MDAIDIDGCRYAWRTEGSGPPLVLLNGYAATNADWDPTFVAALAETFEVLLPDHRGMGESERGEGPVTIDGMAADAEALLDARALGRVALAGWSMGGFVAQRLALRAPERVASLALLSTDPGGAEAVLADPGVWARLVDHGGTPREQATRLLSLLFPPPVAADIDRRFGDVVAAARARLDPGTLSDQESAIAAWHGEEQPRAPAGAFPVRVVHGDADVVIPPVNADALARRWPGATVTLVDGAGHAFMAQEPGRVAGLLASLSPA
jgi:pimeloyl-ACP methyl ester carboxylesterase